MRVCMLTLGVFNYTVSLTAALSKYCEMELFCSERHLRREDPAILNILEGKCAVHRFEAYRTRDPRNLLNARALCREIARGNYDVIHIQEYSTPWIAMAWGLCAPCPLVTTIHDPYQHPGLSLSTRIYQDFMQRRAVKQSDKIIVLGELLKRQLLERYRFVADDDVSVIPLGPSVPEQLLKEGKSSAGESSERKRVLFFGEVRPNKGLEYLLKAEPLIRKQIGEFELVIAGKCENFETYRKLIAPGARVSVRSEFVPDADIPRYFGPASVVALPYISATQSGIIPMAYAFGKPVVATRTGALPEVVQDGQTGLLVEPRDEAALAEAIVQLLKDDKLRRDMGERALQYLNEKLSWDGIARQTAGVYESALGKRRRR